MIMKPEDNPVKTRNLADIQPQPTTCHVHAACNAAGGSFLPLRRFAREQPALSDDMPEHPWPPSGVPGMAKSLSCLSCMCTFRKLCPPGSSIAAQRMSVPGSEKLRGANAT